MFPQNNSMCKWFNPDSYFVFSCQHTYPSGLFSWCGILMLVKIKPSGLHQVNGQQTNSAYHVKNCRISSITDQDRDIIFRITVISHEHWLISHLTFYRWHFSTILKEAFLTFYGYQIALPTRLLPHWKWNILSATSQDYLGWVRNYYAKASYFNGLECNPTE